MSDTHIQVQFFAEAEAQTPPVEVEAALLRGRDMGHDDDAGMSVKFAPIATVEMVPPPPPVVARQITVGVLPVWGIALAWVLLIVGVSQATKRVLVAGGLKERLTRRSWQRWMYVVPIVWGSALSGFFGPDFVAIFGIRMGVLPSLLFLGPGSGATAAFAYDATRSVLLPVLPAAALAMLERFTGITLPDSVKDNARLDYEESEAHDA